MGERYPGLPAAPGTRAASPATVLDPVRPGAMLVLPPRRVAVGVAWHAVCNSTEPPCPTPSPRSPTRSLSSARSTATRWPTPTPGSATATTRACSHSRGRERVHGGHDRAAWNRSSDELYGEIRSPHPGDRPLGAVPRQGLVVPGADRWRASATPIHCRRPDDGSGTGRRPAERRAGAARRERRRRGPRLPRASASLDVSPDGSLARLVGRPRRRRGATPSASATCAPAGRPTRPSPTSRTASPGRPTARTCFYTDARRRRSARTRCAATSSAPTPADRRRWSTEETDERFFVDGRPRAAAATGPVIAVDSAVTSESLAPRRPPARPTAPALVAAAASRASSTRSPTTPTGLLRPRRTTAAPRTSRSGEPPSTARPPRPATTGSR